MIKSSITKPLLIGGILLTVFILSRVFAKEEQVPMLSTKVNLPVFEGDVSWVDRPYSNASSLGNLIGIHGTPGSWTAWKPLMEEAALADYKILAFDRAGWGQTMGNSGQVIPNLKDQSDILAAAIRPMNLESPTVLVAHSWGGPVALALAIYHPDLVDGMLLIASPANPKISQPRWYHNLAKAKPIQWLIGKSMTRSNIEMLALESELETLVPNLKDITIPIVIMQGKKDWLVKPENAFFLSRSLQNSNVKLVYDTKANHFIPFSQTDKVALEVQWLRQQIAE